MKWTPEDCKPGDMIRVRIGSICHYGICSGENEVIQFGLPPTPESLANPSSVKVCVSDLDEFSRGNIIERASLDFSERRKRFSPAKTVERARARIGEGGYDILHNNCEHFAYECMFGVKKSTQEEAVRDKWRAFMAKNGK